MIYRVFYFPNDAQRSAAIDLGIVVKVETVEADIDPTVIVFQTPEEYAAWSGLAATKGFETEETSWWVKSKQVFWRINYGLPGPLDIFKIPGKILEKAIGIKIPTLLVIIAAIAVVFYLKPFKR